MLLSWKRARSVVKPHKGSYSLCFGRDSIASLTPLAEANRMSKPEASGLIQEGTAHK